MRKGLGAKMLHSQAAFFACFRERCSIGMLEPAREIGSEEYENRRFRVGCKIEVANIIFNGFVAFSGSILALEESENVPVKPTETA